VAEVATHHLDVLQPDVTEICLARDVFLVPVDVAVVGAGVLTDDPALDVEEVGYGDQPAVEVEDRAVDEWAAPPGAVLPDEPEPVLLG
jgi:hypothetical protein